MTKLNKWVIKHPSLAFYTASIFELIALALPCFTFGWSILSYVIVGLWILFINKFSIASAAPYEINKAIKKLNRKCDPVPLYDISVFIAECEKNESHMLLLLLNKCAALNSMGRYGESREILNTLTDKMQTMTPRDKLTYCINMVDTHVKLGNTEEAETWLGKTLEIYNAQTDILKEKFTTSLDMNTAEFSLLKGDYDRVGELLGKIHMPEVQGDLEFRLLRAKYNIYTNNPMDAKPDLEYVVAKGNKLCIVEEAKKLLSEIDQ